MLLHPIPQPTCADASLHSAQRCGCRHWRHLEAATHAARARRQPPRAVALLQRLRMAITDLCEGWRRGPLRPA